MKTVQVKNLWDILRKRYPAKEYALMAEVSDAAGFYRSNSADYIAVNLWPSRGLAINGIELKCSRSDWLSELKKPNKAENIFKYCDYFWLLTADDTIAKIEEIPLTWGWMFINGAGIKVKKDAPKLTPIQLDKHFMVAMLKRAEDKTGFVHRDSIEDRITEAAEKSLERRSFEDKRKIENAENLQSIISEFEESSGVKLSGWSHHSYPPKKVGEAIKFISNGGIEEIKKDLERLKITANKICEKINSTLNLLQDEPTKQ